MYPAFRTGVEALLKNWNALQFAVQQQTGGPQSKEIADWMVGVVEQFFYENEDLDGEEVGDFLSTLMDQELNTEICDQSEDEIGHHLCQFFKLCSDGNSNQVLEEISKIPSVSIGSCSVQEESSEMCGEVSSVAEDVSGLQLNEEGCEEPPRELTELEKQQLQDEADGWTVIRKGNKKR
ncbi:pre-rRNA-processing protein TSR2 homolog [Macrobrachium rosenbergii]|uniref:pre-rRNA-processing protein TSR2 homolog n=1 Tax=Macrobrachium rosenbergii TaxID=79674 RepID=UPI0034D77496